MHFHKNASAKYIYRYRYIKTHTQTCWAVLCQGLCQHWAQKWQFMVVYQHPHKRGFSYPGGLLSYSWAIQGDQHWLHTAKYHNTYCRINSVAQTFLKIGKTHVLYFINLILKRYCECLCKNKTGVLSLCDPKITGEVKEEKLLVRQQASQWPGQG